MKTTTTDASINWHEVAEQMRAWARSRCWELRLQLESGVPLREVDDLRTEICALYVEAGDVEGQGRTNE